MFLVLMQKRHKETFSHPAAPAYGPNRGFSESRLFFCTSAKAGEFHLMIDIKARNHA